MIAKRSTAAASTRSTRARSPRRRAASAAPSLRGCSDRRRRLRSSATSTRARAAGRSTQASTRAPAMAGSRCAGTISSARSERYGPSRPGGARRRRAARGGRACGSCGCARASTSRRRRALWRPSYKGILVRVSTVNALCVFGDHTVCQQSLSALHLAVRGLSPAFVQPATASIVIISAVFLSRPRWSATQAQPRLR